MKCILYTTTIFTSYVIASWDKAVKSLNFIYIIMVTLYFLPPKGPLWGSTDSLLYEDGLYKWASSNSDEM